LVIAAFIATATARILGPQIARATTVWTCQFGFRGLGCGRHDFKIARLVWGRLLTCAPIANRRNEAD
jgi:hypothetical protein